MYIATENWTFLPLKSERVSTGKRTYLVVIHPDLVHEVLLDTKTGYRSQYHSMDAIISITAD